MPPNRAAVASAGVPAADQRPPLRPRVVLRDPRAIKALTHPARLAVIDELFAGRELTATECAEIAGLSPSAMSYHLRELEKAGIVERAESSDGRERPWRAAGSGLEVHSTESHLASVASATLSVNMLERIGDGLQRWLAAAESDDRAWRDVAGISNARLWLTLDELTEYERRLHEFVEARRGRTEDDHPDGARAVRLASITYPLDVLDAPDAPDVPER